MQLYSFLKTAYGLLDCVPHWGKKFQKFVFTVSGIRVSA